jgi:hypothetical protein
MAFAIQWTLATMAGVTIGHMLADFAWFGLSSRRLFPLLPYGGATLGLAVGVLQWLILRRRVPRSGLWIVATTAGWAGSWVFGSSVALVIATGGGDVTFFLATACGTPIVGLAQRHFLRGWSTRADAWLMVSTAGWILWLAVEVFAPGALPTISAIAGAWVSAIAGYQASSTVGATIVGGLCVGGITGAGMAWALAAPGAVKPVGIRT